MATIGFTFFSKGPSTTKGCSGFFTPQVNMGPCRYATLVYLGLQTLGEFLYLWTYYQRASKGDYVENKKLYKTIDYDYKCSFLQIQDCTYLPPASSRFFLCRRQEAAASVKRQKVDAYEFLWFMST